MSHPTIPEEAFVDAEPGDWFDPAWVPEGWAQWPGPSDTVLASRQTGLTRECTVQALWQQGAAEASVSAYMAGVSATLKVARHRVADAGHLLAAMATALAACRRGLQ